MNIDDMLAQFKAAANAFAKGDPEPMKALFSHRDDVTLANPFGPAVLGWGKVSSALEYAASRFSEGEMSELKTIARYETPDLVTSLDSEHWRTKVAGGELSDMDLRVTTTYRNEDGIWKIAHRHADPIATFDDRGPLRMS